MHSPFHHQPFILGIKGNCGTFWQFKDIVVGWALGMFWYKSIYLHLLYKEQNSMFVSIP
jgi:hypothetical protein